MRLKEYMTLDGSVVCAHERPLAKTSSHSARTEQHTPRKKGR